MAKVTITRLYKRNEQGDYLGAKVTLHGYNSRGRLVLSKELVGKVGTADERGEYTLDVGGKTVTRVGVNYSANAVFEWHML